MKFRRWNLFTTAFLMATFSSSRTHAAEAAGHPVVPGFERFFAEGKTDAARGGWLLLGELNCVSCHLPGSAPGLVRGKQAPVLDEVGGRVRIGHLKKFLRDPQSVKPGTAMPDVLAGDPRKEEKVEALVHFLASAGSLRHERPSASAAAAGRDLYHKVGCIACHGTRDAAGKADKVLSDSVPLGDLGAKYSLTSLREFLETPLRVRPSGRMPGLVTGKEAKDVANYLLQGAGGSFARLKGVTSYAYYEGSWDKLPEFDKLKPQDKGVSNAFDLGVARRENDFALRFEGFFKLDKEGKYRFHLTSDDGSKLWVDGKEVVDNDGVHPPRGVTGEVHLSPGVHKTTVAFFQVGGGVELDVLIEGAGLPLQNLGGLVASTESALEKKARPSAEEKSEDDLDVQPALVEKGKALFASLGCAGCHTMTVEKKQVASGLKAPPLAGLKGEGGCLAPAPRAGVPWFALSPAQRSALAAAMHDTPVPASPTPALAIRQALLAFNCYACHAREKQGGPPEEFNKLFRTDQQEMGDEARIPPPLDGVGAKLNPEYLKTILDRGAHDRPYMFTHMPAFGQANVGHLAQAFAQEDHLRPTPAVHFAEPAARVKAAGRQMVGVQGFGCISCHTFHGVKAQGVQGIDMTLMPRRLRRDWFHAYLLDPQKIRPGTRMPTAWPNGQSVLPAVLGGKADGQVEAIWAYLNDGHPPLPLGLNKVSIPLTPGKEAILYRNFIEGAGTRAVGVGYPEKVNLAFDANELCLALIWQGAFLDAARHWTDRGAGFEGPLGDNVLHLPRQAGFAVLSAPDTPWPSTPAREQGQRFLGYRLTPDERPTFLYSVGGVRVEDFPNPVPSGKEVSLRRVLKLATDRDVDRYYFRAAVGDKIEELGQGWYRIDGWKMWVESAAAPVVRPSGGKKELLVPVRFVEKKARIVQEFVW